MIANYFRGCSVPSRTLAFGTRRFLVQKAAAKTFLSPQELVEKRKTEQAESQHLTGSLLDKEHVFQAKIVPPNVQNDATSRPVPLNVELLQYKPLKLKPTHGHKVAEIKFSGFDDLEVLRMAEFSARAAYYLGMPASDVERIRTEKKLITVIRSPFAQAKSKENFYKTTYKRKLTVYDANPEVVDLWMSYINNYAPESVAREAQIFTRESLDYAETMGKLSAEEMSLPQAYSENLDDPVGMKVQELLGSEAFKESMK